MTKKRHPAIVGEHTAYILQCLKGYGEAHKYCTLEPRPRGHVALAVAEHMLALVLDDVHPEHYPVADYTEALTLWAKANAGDPEAKAIVDSVPTWREEDPQGWSEEISTYADWGLRQELGAAPKAGKRKGKQATTPAQDGQDELQRIEEHADRLPKAWAPDVRPNSATHLVWQALNKLYADRGAPVPEQDLKDEVLTSYFSADMSDTAAAFRKAKHNLKEQKAFKESPEGLTPRRTK